MKISVLKYFCVGAATLGLAISAQANLITGSVQMSGAVTLDTDNLATATTASFSNPAGFVTAGSGSYTGTGGSAVNFYNFNIVTGTQAVSPLWSFVYNGWTYEFNLGQINSVGSALGDNTRSTGDLLVKGAGTVTITGTGSTYTDTPANWSFDVTDTSGGTSGVFTFGFAQSDTALPDGGMALSLLGMALVGVEGLRRKLAS